MKIKALVAAVLAASVAPAFAAPQIPGVNDPAFPDASYPVLNVYGSGATAVDKQLKSLATQICKANTLSIFSDDVTKPEGNKYSAYYCIIDNTTVPTLSSTAKYHLFLHKNSNGGSANGILPLSYTTSPQNQEEQIVVSTGSGSNCGTAAAGTDSVSGAPIWVCNKANTVNAVLDFGISDVEPQIFVNNGLTLGPSPVLSVAGNANTFGIAVTVALRNALQAAQGLTVGSNDVDQAPNLSRAEVSSILSGGVTDWSQFTDASGTPLPSIAGVTAPVNTSVQIARRTSDSGTQAQAGVFFNGIGCAANVPTFLDDNTPFSPVSDGKTADDDLTNGGLGGVIVHEFAGSGGVTDALNVLNDANAWAVGILSLEKNSSKFKFVKIDGAAPTLKNVATNKYAEWFTSSINTRSPAPAGDKGKVITLIKTDASKPANIKLINDGLNAPKTSTPNFTGTDSEVGLLALAYRSGGASYSYATPVVSASREGATGTGAPNSCATPVVWGNSRLK